MAKLTLTDLTGGYGAVTSLNNNFDSIESEFQSKVLYRDNPSGEPNQMENDLDMNSNDILNASEVDTAQLRLNGSLVTFGSNAIENTFQETEFTSVAGQTLFSVTYTPGFLIVLINGVELADADFTATNGTSVTLASAVADNADIVTFRAFGSFNVADALAVSNNLSDVSSASSARTNLSVYSQAETSNLLESHAELGTATFSSDVYTFTPVSGVFNTLTAGMMVSFSLPASSSNTTTTPSINYNGTSYTMKYIDGSAFAVGDLDDTYNKQNLLWKYDGTDFLLASDIRGATWEKKVNGILVMVFTDSYTGNGSDLQATQTVAFPKSLSTTSNFSANINTSDTTGASGVHQRDEFTTASNTTTLQYRVRMSSTTSDTLTTTCHVRGRWY